jgi:hypothetical protein
VYHQTYRKISNHTKKKVHNTRSQGSSVSMTTWLHVGRPKFDSWQGQELFLFPTSSRLALGPTQPPIQRVSGSVSQGIKRLGRGADDLSPCNTEFENSSTYTSYIYIYIYIYIYLHGLVLNEAMNASSYRDTWLSTRTTLSLHNTK